MGLRSSSKFLFLPKTLAKVILDRTRAEYKGARFHEWNRVTNDQRGGMEMPSREDYPEYRQAGTGRGTGCPLFTQEDRAL
jgi:hypothetical protein